MQPGQKNQQSCPPFSNIKFHWISQLNVIFHTAKERSGWYANFMGNGSLVIFSRSKLTISLYYQMQQAPCIFRTYKDSH